MSSAGERLVEALDLSPPSGGGWFRRTFAGQHHSAILFLLADGEFSALHRLTAPAEYSFLAGAPLEMLLLDGTGAHGVTLDRVNPQVVVPPGKWQGSSSAGRWTRVATQVTPPFEWSTFEVGDRAALQRDWPAAAERIAALTRVPT